ncbi:MAG: exo-alpha-sialidase [Phycisphaerae bacterium]|nr:exo-alpha-sialidase [Phycisphaerae bacterium]
MKKLVVILLACMLCGCMRFENPKKPYVVGTPPVDAGRGLIRISDTEIRHYAGRDAAAYTVSFDNGQSWHEKLLPENYPPVVGPTKESPVIFAIGNTGEFARVSTIGGFCYISEGGIDGKWNQVKDKDGEPLKLYGITHQPIFIRNGTRCLMPGHIGGTWVYYSDDNCQTWKKSNTVHTPPHKPGGIHKGTRWNHDAAEPCLVELNDGSVMRLIRCAQDNHYQSFSSDGGETWTIPEPSRFYGTITMPKIARLKDGRLLMLWNNTTPLAELARATGRGEDVFTNRDVSHAAISEDDGKTWIGFRETIIDEHRNNEDYAVTKGSNDRGKQQNQHVELGDGKILIAIGQHPLHRKFIIIDTDWLYETERQDDFSNGLADWSTHKYIAGIKGHCGYNRKPGAVLVNSPTNPDKKVLNVKRADDASLVSQNDGAVWNFPAGLNGIFSTRIMLKDGFKGSRISLIDRWFNPIDNTAVIFAMFNLEIPADGKINVETQLEPNKWYELKFKFENINNADGKCRLFINGTEQAKALPLNRPSINGISYVHFLSTAEMTDNSGMLIDYVKANIDR